jgi:lysophospholipase L1-like esterase
MAWRTALANFALLCASLAAVFGVLEAALRAVYPAPARFLYPQEAYVFDPAIGHALRPGQAAFTHDRPVRINALGLRDDEISPRPVRGVWRVLALGDSQTFGTGLDIEETWPKQLERVLNDQGPLRWEVVNAGIPGTDTWQHEILLERLLEALHPRVVVLALYVNDVVPRHDPRIADATTQTNTWAKRLAYLLKRSAVLTWLYHRVLLPLRAIRSTRGGSVEDAVLAGMDDPRAERGWGQVEASLAAMKRACDARRASLLVAILPRRDQVSGQHPGRVYNQRAAAIASAHGIPVVDLLPDLASAYQRRGDTLFIHWDGHNSAAANRVIATRLAPALLTVATPGS